MKYKCLCCDNLVFDNEPEKYSICPICGWENDSVQNRDESFAGGANNVCLKQARVNFRFYGKSDISAKSIIWSGKKKAVTFSYDDGVVFDRRLVEIFNKYGLKCTFNINSGIMSGDNKWVNNGVEIRRMNAKGLPELYAGHEIAVHCLTHADLTKCDDETIYNEVLLDKDNLERMFNCKIEGMAYPYGTFNEHIVKILKDCGIKYSRTVWSMDEAAKPENMLMLRPTFHHNDEKIFDVIEKFINMDADEMEEPQMLYIWGHSYEFAVNDNWDRIEKICSMLAGKDDIFYGTNAEVLSPFYE